MPVARLALQASSAKSLPKPKGTTVFRADLDAIDIKILRELQQDGRMTNVELAERVGISAPPCLRRVRKLEEAGVIEGYHALLNGPKMGFDLVAFCMVGLKRQADGDLKSFASRVEKWPIVREAWMVSGDSDFLLRCTAQNLSVFQDFVMEVLTADEHVDTVRTMLTIRQVKKLGLVEVQAPPDSARV
nr:Lrp/AsnC family transcriptional regulator [Rhizobium halophilum]